MTNLQSNQTNVVFYKNGSRFINQDAAVRVSKDNSTTSSYFDYVCYDYYDCQWSVVCGDVISFTFTNSRDACSYPYVEPPCWNGFWSLSYSVSTPICDVIEYPDPPFPGAPAQPPLPGVSITDICKNYGTLPADIKKLFDQAFLEVKSSCVGSEMLRFLKEKKAELRLRPMPAPDPGAVNPPMRYTTIDTLYRWGHGPNWTYFRGVLPAILYNTENVQQKITGYNFYEELFHAYQDKYYPNGIWGYTGVGRSNIEFEAKVLRDIDCLIREKLGVFAIQQDPSYILWLNELVSDNKYPVSYSEISDKYFYFLEIFKAERPEYNSPTDPNLTPQALFDVINKSACSK